MKSKCKTEQTVPLPPEREDKHLHPGFRWGHRLPAGCCDVAHRSSETVSACRGSVWQDSPHWIRLVKYNKRTGQN